METPGLYRTPVRLLDILRNTPRLGAYVRFIRFVFDASNAASCETRVALLELCPRLEGIHIFVDDPLTAFDPTIDARLRAAQLQPAYLEIQAKYPAMMEWMLQLWPSVRALSVSVQDVDGWVGVPEIHIPDTVQSMTILFNQDIDYLLGGTNIPLLRELELKWFSWNNFIRRRLHLSNVLPHLRTLRIDGHFPPQVVLMRLTHLEILIVSQFPVGEADITLPRALLHVGYHEFHGSFPAFSWLEHTEDSKPFIAALRVLSRLQRVSVMRSSSTPHAVFCLLLIIVLSSRSPIFPVCIHLLNAAVRIYQISVRCNRGCRLRRHGASTSSLCYPVVADSSPDRRIIRAWGNSE
ncbi:hypothetical protein FA95DRAFT_1113652 [Auriscalpium vulgare]|uniref:Uncharacterized protein n=1 Tax=Auriscalpium vulgare TaxID=40419 RepID=A0ACB8R4X0_9AGAM|nr:hypothetical protein FA95DRAFT_1113652 [Auriscalpium vulgare]